MAALDLDAVMTAIETALSTITSLSVDTPLTDQMTSPVAIVGLPPISDYHAAMQKGTVIVEPTITIVVSKQIGRVGLRQLAAYANPTGTSSVVVAIETDRTLGGKVDDCIVVDFRPLAAGDVNYEGFVGGVFTLKVAAVGK